MLATFASIRACDFLDAFELTENLPGDEQALIQKLAAGCCAKSVNGIDLCWKHFCGNTMTTSLEPCCAIP